MGLPPISEFTATHCSNPSWSVAPLTFRDVPLRAAIASSARARRSEFEVQSRANTLWAFATMLCEDRPLIKSIAASSRRIRTAVDHGLPADSQDLCPKVLAHTAWAV